MSQYMYIMHVYIHIYIYIYVICGSPTLKPLMFIFLLKTNDRTCVATLPVSDLSCPSVSRRSSMSMWHFLIISIAYHYQMCTSALWPLKIWFLNSHGIIVFFWCPELKTQMIMEAILSFLMPRGGNTNYSLGSTNNSIPHMPKYKLLFRKYK